MSQPKGPSVRRRIVASELKRLRLAAGLQQQQVAEEVGLLPTAISRYEQSVSSMNIPVAERLFRLYGLEGDELAAMLELVRASRKRGMLADVKNQVWPPMTELVALERDASEIQDLALRVIPGLLQTEDYARAILQAGTVGADVERHVTARMTRAKLLEKDVPPEYWAIVTESALRCQVGGREVIREQVGYLRSLMKRPNITVQILTDRAGAHPSMVTPFILMRYQIAPAYGIVYMDHLTGALYLDEPTDVDRYDRAYRHLIKTALSERQSAGLLSSIEQEYGE